MYTKIGFDLDGVLYDWHEEVFNFLRGEDIIRKDLSYEYFWKNFDNLLSKDEWKLLVNIGWLYSSRPIDKSKLNILNILNSQGHEIFYISSRPCKVYNDSLKWMRVYNLPRRENFHLVNSSKFYLVNQLGIDIFVDDRPEHLISLGSQVTKILVVQPWNKHRKEEFNHIYHLGEIYKWIE